jgi:hypothetical protein
MAWARAWVGSLLTLAACGTPSADPATAPYPLPVLEKAGPAVATVGPVTLTQKEIEKRIGGQSPVLVQRFREELDRRKEFVQQQVRFEVLAQEAWQRRMYEDPDMVAELKKAMVQKLIRQELDARTKDQAVSEGELRDAYNKSLDEFIKPETIRLSQIVRRVDDPKARSAARALLERVKGEVLAAEKRNVTGAFGEPARKHSQDPDTATAGGELQFMTRKELEEKYGPDVARVMFEDAKVGDMVVADAADASVLFKKTGLRRAVERTLDQVRPQLRARILRDKRNEAFEAFIVELEKRHHAVVDAEALARMGVSATATAAAPGAP